MIRFPSSNPYSTWLPCFRQAPLPPRSLHWIGQGTSSRPASVEALPLALLHHQSFPNLAAAAVFPAMGWIRANLCLKIGWVASQVTISMTNPSTWIFQVDWETPFSQPLPVGIRRLLGRSWDNSSMWSLPTICRSLSYRETWETMGFSTSNSRFRPGFPYLVGGFNPSEKYESQLGVLFPIYGNKWSKPPTSYRILIDSWLLDVMLRERSVDSSKQWTTYGPLKGYNHNGRRALFS